VTAQLNAKKGFSPEKISAVAPKFLSHRAASVDVAALATKPILTLTSKVTKKTLPQTEVQNRNEACYEKSKA
jgi:hypothetical protein